jgi:hypothetical protein
MVEWKKGIEDGMSFIADPDIHRTKMIGLATAAFRARQVDADQYGEMLELLDCAILWAEEELIYAEMIGLFRAADIG